MKFPNRIQAYHDDTRIAACTLTGFHSRTKVFRMHKNHSAHDAARILHSRAIDHGFTACIESYDYGYGWEPVVLITRTYKLGA